MTSTRPNGMPGVEATGRRGNARALEPAADVALIARIVQAAVTRAPLSAMFERAHEKSYA